MSEQEHETPELGPDEVEVDAHGNAISRGELEGHLDEEGEEAEPRADADPLP